MPFALTGIALDEQHDSLLLLESDNDLLYEFSTKGTQIGQLLTTDQVTNNGFGLEYDDRTGTLFVTSQTAAGANSGLVTEFRDASRAPAVPVPAAMWLGTVGAVLAYRTARKMARGPVR